MIRHKNRYSTRPVIGSKWQLILMSTTTRGVQGARTSYNNRVVLALHVLLWDLLECGRSQSTTPSPYGKVVKYQKFEKMLELEFSIRTR